MDTTAIVAIMAALLGGGGVAGLVAFRKAPAEIGEIQIRASQVNVQSAGEVVGLQREQLMALRDEVSQLREEVARLTTELADAKRRNGKLESRIAQLGG